MSYLVVGLGGACGSLLRYILGAEITRRSKHTFPIGTVIINISGAMLLGFISHLELSPTLLLLLADGFLGAYTTFSTFMYEGFSLFHDAKRLNAVTYVAGTLILGLIFYCAGIFIAGLVT